MTHRMLLVLALTTLVGCAADSRPAGPRLGGSPDDAGITTAPPLETDLPCEVAEMLVAHCSACHGAIPAGGAPMSLITRADLMRASTIDPTQTLAARSVVRMRAATLPMPPTGAPVDDVSIAALEAWIADGMPAGSCTVDDPWSTPVQCTSMRRWTRGTDESPEMKPGGTCVSCHDREAPERRFWAAGTLYPSAHEPDDCSGADTSGTAIVEITDAEGRISRMTANRAGNFFLMRPTDEDIEPGGALANAFAYPYTARVLYDGRERVMLTPQINGDCNACHTTAGTMGAPGRIVLP
ncbi:hypothetical protein [Sandaracinus amylolyticus]|uniref:hypothetical protein n=1 Tax=Sandaracinus amylolyticus TaxID=927083 RepID=UPI001F189034|nr:hypothetical protein [Sandaracinus amylolyticus]UJR84976.1 Hypothetical protein I5071_70550 [Sandaracinus amylolyticus]